MPFTPLHMGPALAIKAVTGRYLSLMVFGFSQVAMDVEPLLRILRGDTILHGYTHTYLGATLIAVASAVIGRPMCAFLLQHWKPDRHSLLLDWMNAPATIGWPAAFAGAFAGVYSHVFLDSIMHSDMRPLAPASQANALLHVISIDALHLACLASAVIGLLIMFGLHAMRRSARPDARN